MVFWCMVEWRSCRWILSGVFVWRFRAPGYLHPKNRRGSPNAPIARSFNQLQLFLLLLFAGAAGFNGTLQVAKERKENQKTCYPLRVGLGAAGESGRSLELQRHTETRNRAGRKHNGRLGKRRVKILCFYFCLLFPESLCLFLSL